MLFFGIFIILTAAALPQINISRLHLTRCASLIFFSAAVLVTNTFNIIAINSGVSLFDGLVQTTPSTQIISLFLCLIASIIVGVVWKTISYSSDKIYSSQVVVSEYPVILIFTTFGGIILVSSTNLITLFLGVELQSFAVYILASLYRNSEKSSNAALQYFFIGGLSSAFILIGGAVVYWLTGSIDLWHIINLLNQMDNNLIQINGAIVLGLGVMLLGFLIKTAAAPFHFWAPDVYSGVPTIVTTWLTLMPKISLLGFVLILSGNLYNIDIWHNWTHLLTTASILSLIIGTIVGLAQTNIKRLLAYSTISHVGFLLLALSVNTEIGVSSFLFYISQYTITTLNAFLILLALGYSLITADNHNTIDIESNNELSGQFHVNSVLGLAFSISLFSIAGVPPLIGFFGKITVLSAAVQSGYNFLVLVGIVTSIISASYYLGLVRVIHFKAPIYSKNILPVAVSPIHSYAISTLTLSLTLFILTPTVIFNSTSLLALSYHQC